MKGTVLDVNESEGTGIISGNDGRRYSFVTSDLRSTPKPQRGMKVDFVDDNGVAKDIYKEIGAVDSVYRTSRNWFFEVLRKYAVFGGRARRREYWYFLLFYVLVYMLFILVDVVAGTIDQRIGLGLFSGIYVLATIVPLIAVTVRRLHDTGRSGWWALIGIIPLVGTVIQFILMLLDSEVHENEYGVSPKYG